MFKFHFGPITFFCERPSDVAGESGRAEQAVGEQRQSVWKRQQGERQRWAFIFRRSGHTDPSLIRMNLFMISGKGRNIQRDVQENSESSRCCSGWRGDGWNMPVCVQWHKLTSFFTLRRDRHIELVRLCVSGPTVSTRWRVGQQWKSDWKLEGELAGHDYDATLESLWTCVNSSLLTSPGQRRIFRRDSPQVSQGPCGGATWAGTVTGDHVQILNIAKTNILHAVTRHGEVEVECVRTNKSFNPLLSESWIHFYIASVQRVNMLESKIQFITSAKESSLCFHPRLIVVFVCWTIFSKITKPIFTRLGGGNMGNELLNVWCGCGLRFFFYSFFNYVLWPINTLGLPHRLWYFFSKIETIMYDSSFLNDFFSYNVMDSHLYTHLNKFFVVDL